MFKSIKKFYEHKRTYDFVETKRKDFVKKRSHKRLRKHDIMLKKEY